MVLCRQKKCITLWKRKKYICTKKDIHAYIYIHTYIYITLVHSLMQSTLWFQKYKLTLENRLLPMSGITRVRARTSTHTYTLTDTHTQTHAHAHAHARIHTCTHKRTCTHTILRVVYKWWVWCVRHDSWRCETWLIDMWDMTHGDVRHD